MKIDIRDNISEEIALELVLDVVKRGRVCQGEHGKMYYCWVTIFNVNGIEYAVSVRQYRKTDFLVLQYPIKKRCKSTIFFVANLFIVDVY